MLDVYLLEDNPEELDQLSGFVKEATETLQTRAKINGFDSVKKLKLAMPKPNIQNVYILDVDVNGDKEAGLKFSRLIRENDLLASIIFITVHDEFLPTTYKYQVEALDFLVKNQDQIRSGLLKDLQKVLKKQRVPDERPILLLRSHYEVFKVPVQEILFFQSNPDNTHQSFLFTTYNERRVINMPLRQLEDRSPQLIRVHRSYLVNLINIQSFDLKDHQLKFTNSDATVPVSRLKTRKLVELLKDGQRINW